MNIQNELKLPQSLAMIGLGGSIVISACYFVSELFHLDVITRDSYIYKSEIEKTYVPIDRYEILKNEIKLLKSDNENLKNQNTRLQQSQSAMSVSVCQRFAFDESGIVSKQHQIEEDIQRLLSPNQWGNNLKSELLMQKDENRAQALRQYSQQLDRQLFQVRSEMAKCNK